MGGGKRRPCRLAPAAATDLEDIWLYTARNWSVEQADRYTDALESVFDTLVAMPEIVRGRREVDPPVHLHPSAQHVFVYRSEADYPIVLRVLGGRQNWQAFLDLAEAPPPPVAPKDRRCARRRASSHPFPAFPAGSGQLSGRTGTGERLPH